METGMARSMKTTDHDEIRDWAEERGARPSVVRDTADAGGSGVLRLDFGEEDEDLEEIEWDEFFEIFDRNDLAFLHQDETASGEMSRFNKFVRADDGA
jgi:hypothetical protein